VHSSKTEQYEDGGIRQVPIFPELLPHLRAVYEQAAEGAEHVITRYRDSDSMRVKKKNLRTQFCRYITAAGLTPWPKPWQNLRGTRATELRKTHPVHVCNAWLGHTEEIANEFYVQVTDEDFVIAARPAQNPAQHTSEHAGKDKVTVGASTG